MICLGPTIDSTSKLLSEISRIKLISPNSVSSRHSLLNWSLG